MDRLGWKVYNIALELTTFMHYPKPNFALIRLFQTRDYPNTWIH